MLRTCKYLRHMPRMIQLRHVPDDLHRRLKARAALEGLSLSDYLLREVRRVAERPTLAELRYRLAPRPPGVPRVPPAQALGAGRGRTWSRAAPPPCRRGFSTPPPGRASPGGLPRAGG